MIGKFGLLTVVATVALVNTACNTCQKCANLNTATDVQVEKMDTSMDDPQDHFVNMADNAMLHDMSVADIHFVPHTTELSGTGATRLNRMATLLDTYGGTVRYETFNTDEELVNRRIEHVREYLALAGCDMGRVDVKTGLSGGRGMAADRAILIDVIGTSGVRDAEAANATVREATQSSPAAPAQPR